jgi:hypothetical protein
MALDARRHYGINNPALQYRKAVFGSGPAAAYALQLYESRRTFQVRNALPAQNALRLPNRRF